MELLCVFFSNIFNFFLSSVMALSSDRTFRLINKLNYILIRVDQLSRVFYIDHTLSGVNIFFYATLFPLKILDFFLKKPK